MRIRFQQNRLLESRAVSLMQWLRALVVRGNALHRSVESEKRATTGGKVAERKKWRKRLNGGRVIRYKGRLTRS